MIIKNRESLRVKFQKIKDQIKKYDQFLKKGYSFLSFRISFWQKYEYECTEKMLESERIVHKLDIEMASESDSDKKKQLLTSKKTMERTYEALVIYRDFFSHYVNRWNTHFAISIACISVGISIVSIIISICLSG